MTAQAINFQKLVDQVQKSKVGSETLSIWGGECAEDEILILVKQWPNQSKMPYRIWEFGDKIEFEKNDEAVPNDACRLERGRIFGTGGDLSLRRDENRFLWRFVGEKGVIVPSIGQVEDFWKEGEPDAEFHQNEESSLLWGERKKGFDLWFDARAAGARLKYPVDKTGRMQINYRTYSRAGRVEFVWFYELEAYNG